jgi:cellulose synthase/poly-beta-1,6-N-acetylglucosamine synthase-like glycosyltransferase
VELIIPCKGVEPELGLLVKMALEQKYPAYGVTFVVESTDDHAWTFLHQLLTASVPHKARLITAGRARHCGQKVHNLLSATAALDPAVEVIAFLDSDVRLSADWLRRLVQPLEKTMVGAVTGYRWFVPAPRDWPSIVLAALNAPVAAILGNHQWNAIWGGSWCIKRSVFELTQIRRAWNGAVTEDYPAWRAVRKAGLRVAYEPACLLASPLKCTIATLVEFARRQYLITRIYAPVLWSLALAGELLFNLVFWGGLAMEIPNWFFRRQLTWISFVVVLLYFLAGARAWLRQSAAGSHFESLSDALLSARRLDIWGQPVLALCNLVLLLSSALGRNIAWRGIRYRLIGCDRTVILNPDSAVGRSVER